MIFYCDYLLKRCILLSGFYHTHTLKSDGEMIRGSLGALYNRYKIVNKLVKTKHLIHRRKLHRISTKRK